jgi:hypothetical protein
VPDLDANYPIRDDEHFAKHSVVSPGKDVIFE